MPDRADGTDPVLSPPERRARNRQAMIDSIVAAARAIMQADGVAALNLNEVARRVKLRPQSLAVYFPNKDALYDELHRRALQLFQEGDEQAYRLQPPSWQQLEAWFTNRIKLARENPDLFHLVFDAPFPVPYLTDATIGAIGGTLASARDMVAELIEARVIDPGIPVEQATDLLLSIRHGLIAERLGKAVVIPADSPRFDQLVPVIIRMLQAAWAPESTTSATRGQM
jgi:AcrR family transcriptional regulator